MAQVADEFKGKMWRSGGEYMSVQRHKSFNRYGLCTHTHAANLHIQNLTACRTKHHTSSVYIDTHTEDRSHSAAIVFVLAGECQSLSSLPPNRCLIVSGLRFNCWVVFQHSEGIKNTPGLQLQQMPALKQGRFWNHCLGGNCLCRKPWPSSALLLWSQKINLCY